MSRYRALTFTFFLLFICPSLSLLNKDELQRAVDAFDGFVDPPKSNKAKDKIDADQMTLLEHLPSVSEPVFVKEADNFQNPVHLNIDNNDLIQLAKDSVENLQSDKELEFVKLIQADREIQNIVKYYLKVEAVEKCENEDETLCNLICDLELEETSWKHEKPHVTSYSCSPLSNENYSNNVDEYDNSTPLGSTESNDESTEVNILIRERV